MKLIAAIDNERGLGKNNTIPWYLPSDLKYFRNVTTKTNDPNKFNAVIMGRITWESIPKKFRPLKNRYNFVISSNQVDHDLVFKTFDECLEHINKMNDIESIYIIGGAQLYNEYLDYCDELYITEINSSFDCDRKLKNFTGYEKKWNSEELKENGIMFRFVIYKKI